MNSAALFTTSILAAGLVFASDTAATPSRGTVLGILGAWTKDGKPLRFGNEVSLGDKLSAERSGSITVEFGDGIVSYSCDQPCTRTLAANDRKPVGGLARIMAVIRPIFLKEGDRLIAAVSRGADVSEAVVPLKGNQVDLSGMLTDLAPGRYSARFKPVVAAGTEGPMVGLQHANGSPSIVTATIRPGLYDVELFKDGQPLGMGAWVLVSGPQTFAADSEAFRQASSVAANWSPNADARSVRAFLRANLESLALRYSGR
jgi:hypothetical protein